MSENNFSTRLLKLPFVKPKLPYVKPKLLQLELNKLIKLDKQLIPQESNNGNLS